VAVGEALRRLGVALTATQLEIYSLGCFAIAARPGDPLFPQRVAFARR
jgi:hypothetical protein